MKTPLKTPIVLCCLALLGASCGPSAGPVAGPAASPSPTPPPRRAPRPVASGLSVRALLGLTPAQQELRVRAYYWAAPRGCPPCPPRALCKPCPPRLARFTDSLRHIGTHAAPHGAWTFVAREDRCRPLTLGHRYLLRGQWTRTDHGSALLRIRSCTHLGAAPPAERAVDLGEKVTQRLRYALGRRLMKAMARGGPAAAVNLCATEAQRITAQINRGLTQGIRVKRTSAKLRNPKNAPDAAERRALARFAARAKKKQPLGHLLDRETTPNGVVHRYYQPIRVSGLCLRCHGPANKIPAAVRAILSKRYPRDQATGYRQGDLRGIFSVTIPAPK